MERVPRHQAALMERSAENSGSYSRHTPIEEALALRVVPISCVAHVSLRPQIADTQRIPHQ